MPAVSPRLDFDPSRRPEVSLRIKPVFVVLFVGAAVASLVGLGALTYSSGVFDPRLPFIAVQVVWLSVIVARSRIVVIDGVLWRRGWWRYRPVDLQYLTSAEFRRGRYLKNEGAFAKLLRVTDASQRTIGLKPVYWTRGRKKLVGIIETAARTQRVNLDDKTARSFASYPADTSNLPRWTRRQAPELAVESLPPKQSTFWTRRNEDGTDKKLQLQRVIAMAGAMVVVFPLMSFIRNVGTDVINGQKCSSLRHLWTDAVDLPQEPYSMEVAAQRTALEIVNGRRGQLFTLRLDQMVNANNTAQVHADSARMIQGFDVGWGGGGLADADVYLEQFPSHADAVQLQRDYAEDHCSEGDYAFSVPSIPGAVGITCRCHGDFVREKVTLVRGTVRVVASVWQAPRGDHHETVTRLAAAAQQGLEVPTT